MVGQAVTLSFFIVNMVTAMGLALGIDYSLFVLSRYREERHNGLEKNDAIVASGATASKAVLFSGSSFVVALCGLLLVPDTILRSLAFGAILVGIVTVVAALTLLPAMLALLGDRVNALRLPFFGREQTGREQVLDPGRQRRRTPTGDRAGRERAAPAPAGLARARPAHRQRRRQLAAGPHLLQGWVPGARTQLPRQQRRPGARSSSPATSDRRRQRGAGPVGDVAGRGLRVRYAGDHVAPRGDVAVVTIPVRGDPNSDRARTAVERLRSDLVPAALTGTDLTGFVGGVTAENIDYTDLINKWLPIVLAFVLGVSLILLTVLFRSLVLAASAVVLNLLSVGAAYGLLVLVFQQG